MASGSQPTARSAVIGPPADSKHAAGAFLGGEGSAREVTRVPALFYTHPAFRLTDSVIRNSLLLMIRSFGCPDTEALFHSRAVVRWKNIERVARRKLLQLQAATELASLRVPPGNRLEALRRDRKRQHSIRINDQWRVCFIWRTDGPHQVEIVDYH
jgi:proteic killer suppression protein